MNIMQSLICGTGGRPSQHFAEGVSQHLHLVWALKVQKYNKTLLTLIVFHVLNKH